MRLMLKICLVLCALAIVSPVLAAPLTTPFLAVDINGYNAGGGQVLGPTAAGFQPFEAAEGLFLDPAIDWGNSAAAGLTKVFATSQGNVTANMIGVVPNSSRGARNRGANPGALGDLLSDFVFAQRDAAVGFGQNYIRLALSGLTPGQAYEVTTYGRDTFNGGTDSFQSWSDIAALGGLDGPGPWMNTNVGAGATYQPAVDGANNPIPKLARSPVTGADSADQYAYAATFVSTASATGTLTLYTWADPNSFTGVQGATLLSGFQIGVVPEPSTAGLLIIGLAGLGRLRRRTR
jgi:hypothetical protein